MGEQASLAPWTVKTEASGFVWSTAAPIRPAQLKRNAAEGFSGGEE